MNCPAHVYPDACRLQAQKELLDTELDLYKKVQAGEDTAELKIKYTQLQLEVFHKETKTPFFTSLCGLCLVFIAKMYISVYFSKTRLKIYLDTFAFALKTFKKVLLFCSS